MYNWAEDDEGDWEEPELGAEWICRVFIGTYAF